ncbi:segregation and condensation protein A [Lacunimicrobium album]
MIAPAPANYRVQMDLYSGPIDLLVYLVKRSELSATNLKISLIVKQFVDYVEVLEYLALDEIGDFLVMITTLLEIKSRELLPRAAEEVVEEEQAATSGSPGSQLIAQLMLHKQFQYAIGELKAKADVWLDRYPRMESSKPSSRRPQSLDYIKDVELWDLVSALSRVIKIKHIEKHERIKFDETPLHIHIKMMADRIKEQKEVSFHSLFKEVSHRSVIVGMFLAILELLRHHGFRAVQAEDHGDIMLYPPVEEREFDESIAVSSSGDDAVKEEGH